MYYALILLCQEWRNKDVQSINDLIQDRKQMYFTHVNGRDLGLSKLQNET